jgi:hypothetical protein
MPQERVFQGRCGVSESRLLNLRNGKYRWDISKYAVHFLEENRPQKCTGLISGELMNVFLLAWMLH